MIMNRQLREIISWRLISEIFRCYPNRFDLAETHPCSGQYDCLSLYDAQGRHILDLNRGGSLHTFINCRTGEYDHQTDERIWDKALTTDDIKDVVTEALDRIGLAWPKKRPAITPKILTYRFIADFLSHAAFGRDQWRCTNGCFDSSEYGFGEVKDFKLFPAAKESMRDMPKKFNNPAYNFWFIRKNNDPLLCLSENGMVWRCDGKTYDLAKLYTHDRRIWNLIMQVAGDLLP
jgi:hypothetical protein